MSYLARTVTGEEKVLPATTLYSPTYVSDEIVPLSTLSKTLIGIWISLVTALSVNLTVTDFVPVVKLLPFVTWILSPVKSLKLPSE